MGHKTRSRKLEAAARSQHPGLFRSGSHEPARTGAASPRSNASVALASAQEWVRWLVPLLVVLCTLAAFLPTLQNHFVNWDDDKNFLDNHHYRGLTWQQLSWMWTTHLGHYIPLTWMTLGMDYLLWGMNPVGYHLTSLLLHATSAVVVFFLARRFLTLALPRASGRGHALTVSAGFAALVFAIHPLRVESVAWATERRDVLSGLFYLLTLLTYLRACERGARGLGVRIELLPLEDGRAPDPLAALHAAADGESRGDAVHRELRRGACRHGDRAGPPPSMARSAGGVAGVRGRPPAGARHRSERPADCGRSIYLSRRPRMGDPGRCRPVVLLAPLHELDDRGTGDVGACRYCHGCRYRVGSPHLEPGPGLARLGEALDLRPRDRPQLSHRSQQPRRAARSSGQAGRGDRPFPAGAAHQARLCPRPQQLGHGAQRSGQAGRGDRPFPAGASRPARPRRSPRQLGPGARSARQARRGDRALSAGSRPEGPITGIAAPLSLRFARDTLARA